MITSDTCHHEEGNATLGRPLKFLESSYSAPEKKKLLCPYKVQCGKLPALSGYQRSRGFCSRRRLQDKQLCLLGLTLSCRGLQWKECQVAYLVSACGTDRARLCRELYAFWKISLLLPLGAGRDGMSHHGAHQMTMWSVLSS